MILHSIKIIFHILKMEEKMKKNKRGLTGILAIALMTSTVTPQINSFSLNKFFKSKYALNMVGLGLIMASCFTNFQANEYKNNNSQRHLINKQEKKTAYLQYTGEIINCASHFDLLGMTFTGMLFLLRLGDLYGFSSKWYKKYPFLEYLSKKLIVSNKH